MSVADRYRRLADQFRRLARRNRDAADDHQRRARQLYDEGRAKPAATERARANELQESAAVYDAEAIEAEATATMLERTEE